MEEQSERRDAFLLRIWREKGMQWRGWVQHVNSRESAYFNNLPDLLEFVQSWTGSLEECGAEKEVGDW